MQEKVQELLEFDQVIYCDIKLSTIILYIVLYCQKYKYNIYLIFYRILIRIANPRIAPINLN